MGPNTTVGLISVYNVKGVPCTFDNIIVMLCAMHLAMQVLSMYPLIRGWDGGKNYCVCLHHRKLNK